MIFICATDVVGRGKARYSFAMRDEDDRSELEEDGRHAIFLSASLYAKAEDPGLAAFLRYVKTGEATDDFTKRLDKAVDEANDSEEAMNYITKEMELSLAKEAAARAQENERQANERAAKAEAKTVKAEAKTAKAEAELEAEKLKTELARLLNAAGRGSEFFDAVDDPKTMERLMREFGLSAGEV